MLSLYIISELKKGTALEAKSTADIVSSSIEKKAHRVVEIIFIFE